MKALAPGFLVAMPQLGDPNFQRTVVLMIEHGEGGAMGLVINRPAPITLKELAEIQSLQLDARREAEAVFVGGPVDPYRGFVLHDCASIRERHEVFPGLFLSVTLDALGPLLLDGEEGTHLRFCLGYSGWGPQQIERELAEGTWLFTEASAQPVLQGSPGELWDLTVRGMGFDPAMLLRGGGMN